MAASKGFGNRTPAAGGGAPAGGGGSRWGGIPSNEPNTPIIKASGEPQRVRLDACEITWNEGSGNETFKCHLTIVASDVHEAGAQVVALYIVNGKSKKKGEGRVQAMAKALMGFDDDAPFHAQYPKGEPIANALNGMDGDVSLLGREAWTIVSRGGARTDPEPDGTPGYYREYEWAPA